jgi:chromosome partitioning protein
MSSKVISFSNQKGGVGKTTLTRELGIYLSSTGRKTLLIDADPQANLTKSLVENEDTIEFGPGGLYEALTGERYQIREIQPRLYILSGSIKLATLEKSLIGEMDAYIRLKELLTNELFVGFEYILIDTPPSLGVLTINALTSARHIIIPMNPAIYSMQGTNDLTRTVAKVKKNLNSDLTLLGVIVNAFDQIPVITREIREEIVASFGEMVFSTMLSKSVKIEEAIAGRRGVIPASKSGDEIRRIGEELIGRLSGKEDAVVRNAESDQREEEDVSDE